MKNPPPDIDSHTPGTRRAEEWTYEGYKEPGREGDTRTARDATGINPTSASLSIRVCHTCLLLKRSMGTMAGRMSGGAPLATLRQFVRKPREKVEVCELCAASLSPIISMCSSWKSIG